MITTDHAHVPLEAGVLEQAITAVEQLPGRAQDLRSRPARHRELGRFLRDVVIAEVSPPLAAWRAGRPAPTERELLAHARAVLAQLRELQQPTGTFASGDNVESPPDTAFTINDLAWCAAVLQEARAAGTAILELLPELEDLLARSVPALVTGGVHTPNHRWELSSALVRLGAVLDRQDCFERAEAWLAEGIDQQSDGLFSERSPNYAAGVSIPSLLVLGRLLERPSLTAIADRATRAQAELTDAHGFIETVCSRRQDQNALFDGGPMHPVLRAHAALTGDPITARAARHTKPRLRADDVLTMLARGLDESATLAPLPESAPDPTPQRPEVHRFEDSGLMIIDHGVSRTILHGGTDVPALSRVTSGGSCQPTFLRLSGTQIRLDHVRLSRDFFSLGPARFDEPVPTIGATDTAAGGAAAGETGGTGSAHPAAGEAPLSFDLHERVSAEYYQPLALQDRRPDGNYPLQFNGRFSAAMDFASRATDEVALETWASVEVSARQVRLRVRCEGPTVPQCLLLSLDGGHFEGESRDADGRALPTPSADGTATCDYVSAGETLRIRADGATAGPAFYTPGEAYTFLGATDLPAGDHLFIPLSSAEELRLDLDLVTHPSETPQS